MITLSLILLLGVMLWVGFKLTGAVLMAVLWLFVKVPIGLIAFMIGIICCCTLILIPVGICLFKVGVSLIIPGSTI